MHRPKRYYIIFNKTNQLTHRKQKIRKHLNFLPVVKQIYVCMKQFLKPVYQVRIFTLRRRH